MPRATAAVGPPPFTRIEGERLLEQLVVGKKLDHGALCLVPTNDIAAVEQVVEQRSGLCTRIEG